MSMATIETAEDRSNPADDWSTFAKDSMDPVKAAKDQTSLAFMQDNMTAPAVERSGGDNGQSLLKLTEIGQDRQSIVRVREWPVVRKERPETEPVNDFETVTIAIY